MLAAILYEIQVNLSNDSDIIVFQRQEIYF